MSRKEDIVEIIEETLQLVGSSFKPAAGALQFLGSLQEFAVGALQLVFGQLQFEVPALQLPDENLAIALQGVQFGYGTARFGAPGFFIVESRFESREDFFKRSWFSEEAVRAEFTCKVLVLRGGESTGVDDKQHVLEPLDVADLVEQAVAIHPGHQNVGDYGVDVVGLEHRKGRDAIGCVDRPVTFGAQGDAQQLTVRLVVVDNQDVHAGGVL